MGARRRPEEFAVSSVKIVMGGYGPATTGFSLALKRIGARLEERFGDAVFRTDHVKRATTKQARSLYLHELGHVLGTADPLRLAPRCRDIAIQRLGKTPENDGRTGHQRPEQRYVGILRRTAQQAPPDLLVHELHAESVSRPAGLR